MNCKYRCSIIFLFVNIVFGIAFLSIWGKNAIISFEVGFFSFLIVLYSTYLSLQKKLKKELKEAEDLMQNAQDVQNMQDTQNVQNTQNEGNSQDPQSQELDEKKPKTRFNFSTLLLGMQLSMGIFRILAYVLLILCVMVLMGRNLFVAPPYIIGIMVCLISVISLKYLSSKHQP